MTIDENCHKVIVEDTPVDIYTSIQAYKEETDIHNIVARAILGDTSALNVRMGQYMDLTEMPETLAQAQNLINSMKEQFEKLPVDIRAKFDHSAEIYVAEYGGETWAEKMGLYQEPKKEEVETE